LFGSVIENNQSTFRTGKIIVAAYYNTAERRGYVVFVADMVRLYFVYFMSSASKLCF
jgi:hypothetical protein